MKRLYGVSALSLILATSFLAGCDRRTSPEEVSTAPTQAVPTPAITLQQPVATPAPTATAPAASSPTPATPINPPKSATLMAQDAGAQINLRSRPDAQSQSKGYGLSGDGVKLLQAAEGRDRITWYYVRFNQSGAEGWIRGDFIDTSGKVRAAAQTTSNSPTACEGLFDETVFTARAGEGGFTRIEFYNLESKAKFGGSLQYQRKNDRGQPIFVGEVSPPAGGSYSAKLTDLSNGKPGPGTQVALDYNGIMVTGTCK